MAIFTRYEYLGASAIDAPAAHRRYYAQFVNASTVAHVVRTVGADRLKASTDPHFNDIPLAEWDTFKGILPVAIRAELLGDYMTLGSIVCIAKEAARQYIESTKGN